MDLAHLRCPSPCRAHGAHAQNQISAAQALYSFLRYNTLAIDFWLGNIVLPEETKQFPENLKSTSWNLCQGIVRPAALCIHVHCCQRHCCADELGMHPSAHWGAAVAS